MSAATTALTHYLALADKVDAFFERVATRHGDQMQCSRGCASCCQPGLSVTPVEAQAVMSALNTLGNADLDQLYRRATSGATAGEGDACVALDEAGSCQIYAGRPLVCRSHGVPLRTADSAGESTDDPVVRLPVVQACGLNFTTGFEAIPPDSVLDQTTLSTTLAAIDALWCDAVGLERGLRYDLAALIASAFDDDDDSDDSDHDDHSDDEAAGGGGDDNQDG